MSGRIRTIKPELLEDAITAGLSDSAFRVFIALILLADDYGNTRAEPRYLEGQIYWSSVPERSVADSSKELGSLVRFYKVRGQLYAHINGWEKHQKISHKGNPRVPKPEDEDSSNIADYGNPPESLHTITAEPPAILRPDLRSPTTITDHEQEQQGAAEPLPQSTAAARVGNEPAAESRTRLVAASPVDPDMAAVVAAVRADTRLSGLAMADVVNVVGRAMPVANRKKLAWYLKSVSDAGADTPGGELEHMTLKRLRAYLENTKAPKFKEPEPSKAYQPLVFSPPKNPNARIDLSKIGNGGVR